MKTLTLAAIRCSLMLPRYGVALLVRPAQAYTVTLQQVGSNVVATGSGAINLTGLTFCWTTRGVIGAQWSDRDNTDGARSLRK